MKTNLKNISKVLTIFLISLSLTAFLSSCKKDSSNPAGPGNGGNGGGGGGNNSITLNGDGWTNQALTVNSSNSSYSTGSQLTVIYIFCADNNQLVIYVPGNHTGTVNFSSNLEQAGGVTLTSGTGQSSKFYVGKDNSGTITISNYGAVGQIVSGTVSGTLVNQLTQVEATINCTFSATRTVDVP